MKTFKININKETECLSLVYQNGTIMSCKTDGSKDMAILGKDGLPIREFVENESEVKDSEKLVTYCGEVGGIDVLVVGAITVETNEDLNWLLKSCTPLYFISGIQAADMHWDPSLVEELRSIPFGDVRLYE